MVFMNGETPHNKGISHYDRPGLPVSAQRVRRLFNNKKADARTRKIPFELSFDEWLDIWLKSGHLADAGCRNGQYVMARFGDKGPYAVGNVKIVTCNTNAAEREVSADGRRRISEANSGNSYCVGRVLSEETKQRIARARKRITTARGG